MLVQQQSLDYWKKRRRRSGKKAEKK